MPMRNALANTLHRLARWLRPKGGPTSPGRDPWLETTFIDVFKQQREPTADELMAELKNTAFTCASINASACAAHPPRLYVATGAGQPRPKCLTRALPPAADFRLRRCSRLPARVTKAARLEEVLDHPLLDLLQKVNPVHNSFDLWELTTLYQEVHGSAYWLLDVGPLGTPEEIWILPAQNVTPRREPGSATAVDYYEYRGGGPVQRLAPERVIHFRYPDPRDPYIAGLSPLRAAFENVLLCSDYLAFKQAKFQNRAIPDAIVSPEEVIGEEERDRLEHEWNTKFRRGGAGRVVVGEAGLRVQLLNQSLGDLAALADVKVTREEIANAFHVPLPFLSGETNLANLQAAEHQHTAKAVRPRLQRRDEKINEQLVPLYDPTGRLFVASDDPVPANAEAARLQQDLDLKYGVVTVNEVRQERGLPPVPWGDAPWLPLAWGPAERTRDVPGEFTPGRMP